MTEHGLPDHPASRVGIDRDRSQIKIPRSSTPVGIYAISRTLYERRLILLTYYYTSIYVHGFTFPTRRTNLGRASRKQIPFWDTLIHPIRPPNWVDTALFRLHTPCAGTAWHDTPCRMGFDSALANLG